MFWPVLKHVPVAYQEVLGIFMVHATKIAWDWEGKVWIMELLLWEGVRMRTMALQSSELSDLFWTDLLMTIL